MLGWGGFKFSMLTEQEKKYVLVLTIISGVILVITAALDLHDHLKSEKDKK